MNRHIPPPSELRVTLLGTGGPELTPDRMGAATLIEAGSEVLLIDAGRHVVQRLYECGVQLNNVTKVLFTHLHSDHIEGLPQLWITPWFLLGRKQPMAFYGPSGTGDMLAGMRQFFGHDLTHRVRPDAPLAALDYTVEEFDGDGIMYQHAGVTVNRVIVDHKDARPAFGFVIDFAGRRVVVSGDCTLSEDLIEAGQGADVVIHNVFAPSKDLVARNRGMRAVAAKLTSPEEAAEVFRRTGTKLGVFTHVIHIDSTDDDIIARTREGGYLGPLVIGQDRMVIEVASEPRVMPPATLEHLEHVTSADNDLVLT